MLYKRVLPLLQREVNKRFDRPEDREDALQETALRIYEKLGTLREPERFSGWALVVCSRVCSNMHRHKNSHDGQEELRPETSTEETKGLDLIPADELLKDINPGARVDGAHVTEVVSRVLEELPVDQRDCLILWMERYSSAEIAEELGMNPSTVRSNIAYAKKKVGKTLKRMLREGTFDYRELSSDPVAAFLALLERFLARGRLVPVSGETVPPAMPGGTAALRRLARDPLTSIVAIVLVVALAIGVALALQTRSYVAPEAQNEPAAVVDQTVPVPTPEEPSEAAPGTAPGEENNPVNPAPPATPTPAAPNAPGGGGGAAAPAQNPVNNTALIRPDGRLTAYFAEDTPYNITPEDYREAEETVLGTGAQLASRNYEVYASPGNTYEKDGKLLVNFVLANTTSHRVKILSIDDYRIRNTLSQTFTEVDFVPEATLVLGPREERALQLIIPEGYYDKGKLPEKNNLDQLYSFGETYHLNYEIVDHIANYSIKEVPAFEDIALTDSVRKLTRRLVSSDPYLYIAKREEKEGDLLFYIGVYNGNSYPVTIQRLEYIKFANLDNTTVAEGRARFSTPMNVAGRGTGYAVLTVPKGTFTPLEQWDEAYSHMEGIIYDMDG